MGWVSESLRLYQLASHDVEGVEDYHTRLSSTPTTLALDLEKLVVKLPMHGLPASKLDHARLPVDP